MQALHELYTEEGNERVGFILSDGSLVESANHSSSPEDTFVVDAEFFLLHLDFIIATWHTHPRRTAEASFYDKQAFANYPDFVHYIVGKDGVRAYEVKENGSITEASTEKADQIARLVEEIQRRAD